MTQDLKLKKSFLKFYEVMSERGVSIDADSGPSGVWQFSPNIAELEAFILSNYFLFSACLPGPQISQTFRRPC